MLTPFADFFYLSDHREDMLAMLAGLFYFADHREDMASCS